MHLTIHSIRPKQQEETTLKNCSIKLLLSLDVNAKSKIVQRPRPEDLKTAGEQKKKQSSALIMKTYQEKLF